MSEVVKLIRHVRREDVDLEISDMLSGASGVADLVSRTLTHAASYDNERMTHITEARRLLSRLELLLDDVEAIADGMERLKLSEELVDE